MPTKEQDLAKTQKGIMQLRQVLTKLERVEAKLSEAIRAESEKAVMDEQAKLKEKIKDADIDDLLTRYAGE